MAKKNKQESFEEQVKAYASQIKEIDDQVEQVRQTPDVFIGPLGDKGFLTMIREIFQNSLDETLKGYSIDNHIIVSFNENDNTVSVEDHGRGIPHGLIAKIFGQTHTSSNYEKQPYVYSAGKNGCGGAVTNMLCHSMSVESYVLGKGKGAKFVEGHIKGDEFDIKKCAIQQGTIIKFQPSESCLKVDRFTITWQDVYSLIASIVPLAPIGTRCTFYGIDIHGVTHKEEIVNKDGIITHLINMTANPMVAPIVITADNGTMKMELAFTYDSTVENGFEQEASFNNTCPTEGGTHLEGALDGIVKFFKEYMNKIYLANVKSKIKLVCSINDVKQGLKLAISTFHLYAMYTGQSKETLSNKDIIPFVSQTTYDGLNTWAQNNGNDLQKLCKYFRTVIELRLKQDKDKIKLANNFKSSILSGWPAKFKKPNLRKGFELIIVEGDSAFGSAENSRDSLTQGIFPIRGKLPNAFEKSQRDMLNNEEVSSILQIIGGGYGKNFDLSKVNVSKVIIMADADPDGKHIITLCLRMLAVYARPLVEAGMVYSAIPPLYGIPTGKGYKFFTDKIDYIQYIQSQFSSSNQLLDSRGKAMTKREITSLLVRTADYQYLLESTAANHAIDPYLLEAILINKDLPIKKFDKIIREQWRFMKCTEDHGIKVLEGLAANKAHYVIVTPQLIAECGPVLKYLAENESYYILNGQRHSLYGVRVAFSRYEPPKLDRFKGLGEMDAEMLGVSTLRPGDMGNRLLIRYTFKDVEHEMQEMRAINSSKDVLLKGLNIARQDIY